MERIVVVSDNHGSTSGLEYVKKLDNIDYYVHCGDNELPIKYLDDWLAVAGNNDWGTDLKKFIIFEVQGIRFLVTHGHVFSYFSKQEDMISLLKEHQCDVLLSGHTHMPMYEVRNGFTMINPGSLAYPRGGSAKSYCIIEIEDGNLTVEFFEI